MNEMAYIMENISIKGIEEALKQTQTVIVPIGIIEQHGYHLPLGTDILNVTEVLKRAEGRLDAVIAPAIPYCYSGGELTGTININPHIFSLFVADLCMELGKMGFKNMVLFLGHGGSDNTSVLKSSLKMLYKKNPQMKDKIISLVDCWELSPTWVGYISGDQEREFHACKIETSLIQYWRPELVGKIVMDEPEIVKMMLTDQDWFEEFDKEIDHPFVIPKPSQRKEIKIGVMGNPHKATRELGEIISLEMEDGLVDYIQMLNKHSAKKPI
jgi:creatinine amidohydrolase